MKSEILSHLYRLIKPHRRKLFLTVLFTGLGTLVVLLEPLVYREVVNDIAGLFVEQTKQDIKKGIITFDAEETDPITGFVEHKFSNVEQAFEPNPTLTKTHVKRPHTRTHVAGRTPQEALVTLLWAVAILFVLSITGYILSLIGDNMHIKLCCLIEQRFIKNVFKHVLKLPISFFSKRSSTAISKQIDQSEQVTEIVSVFSQQLLPEMISFVGILSIMFWQNATLTLIAVAVVPIYVIIAIRSSKKLETGLDEYYARWEDVESRISGAIGGVKTVKLSGAESKEVSEYEKQSDKAYQNYIRRSLLSNRFAFWQNILTQVSRALVLGYGGYLSLKHKLTPGDVVMFVSYLDRLYSPIDELSGIWVSVQQNLASISRAFRLLDINAEEKGGVALSITSGLVEFKDVHFGYTNDREILKGLTLTFQPGKITAIVGGSGAGKTTTVDLLMKLFEPTSGDILIDGKSIKQINASSLRAQIGMVATEGSLFPGTLAENIAYRAPTSTLTEIELAAEQAGLKHTVERLPEGLQTEVGPNGIGLSVGEKQRMIIARVLLSKNKILVLDEATANLDYNTEAEVKKAVEQLRHDSTIIIIAHRFSMINEADYVYVLNDGQVTEHGRPEDLIKATGWFADFAASVYEDRPANEEIISEEETDDDAL